MLLASSVTDHPMSPRNEFSSPIIEDTLLQLLYEEYSKSYSVLIWKKFRALICGRVGALNEYNFYTKLTLDSFVLDKSVRGITTSVGKFRVEFEKLK